MSNGHPDTSVNFDHNSFYVGDDDLSGILIGETVVGFAGMLKSCQSNIFWNETAATAKAYKIIRHTGSTTQDFANADDVDYNCSHNLQAGSEGNGIHCLNTGTAFFTTGTPETNGITADPQYTDYTRSLEAEEEDGGGGAGGGGGAEEDGGGRLSCRVVYALLVAGVSFQNTLERPLSIPTNPATVSPTRIPLRSRCTMCCGQN